jgi:ribose transport system permease protein
MSIKRKANTIASRIFAVRESGIIIPTVLFIIIIAIVNPVFLSSNNMFNVLRSTGFTLITALGMTLVLIAQGLDLSVGSVLALGGCVSGIAMFTYNIPIFPAILLGCAAGFIIGLANGLVIIKFKIPPLIMTLGMMYMARGIVYIMTKGVPLYPLTQQFQAIEQQDLFGIPKIVVISGILAIIAHVFLTHTIVGRSIYAVGGNREAANLSGINMNKINLICYCITGTLAAATGVIMASRLGSAQPSAGASYEMTVIAAVIIGGTSTSGGSGTILGTTIGALFMNILANAMTIMKISVYWQNFVIGFVLVLAVVIDQIKKEQMLLAGIKAKE